MIGNPLRTIGKNLGTFVLSLLLAVTVWASAVLSADPNQNCVAPRRIPLVVLGENSDYLRFGDVPDEVTILIRAPRSICQELNNTQGAVKASIDVTDLGVGQHTIPVNLQISESVHPYQLVSITPSTVAFELQEFATKTVTIQPILTGEPAPGYNIGATILSPSRVVISGTRTLVDQVAGVTISLDVTDVVDEINVKRSVRLVDLDGNLVTGLDVVPNTVDVRQFINRPGTFRDVIVRVVYEGQPAEGYRLTSITSAPPVVTVFSPDPAVIREMPGFVETTLVDLTDATDDVEQRVSLILPEGVSIVGEQNVLVQIGIAAIETSQTMSLVVETIGLSDIYTATISPQTVDVILSGPLPILENLTVEDVRVVLDLTELEPGVYTLEPFVEVLFNEVVVESILPGTIDVQIAIRPTITPTPEGTTTSDTEGAVATATPTPFLTPTPTEIP